MTFELYQKFSDNLKNFGYLDFFQSIAIAVSGGSDSMALLDLSSKWANTNNKKIIVIHVDHNLRESSRLDAMHVENYCKTKNLECYILNWQHEEIQGNIQQKARLARYSMIKDLCCSLDVNHLLTGHHLEDNAENFIQRFIRGSGVIGLAYSNEHFFNNLRILRPLHNILKGECVEYLKLRNIEWREDETNQSTKYLRNDIRANLQNILEKQHISYDQLLARIGSTQNHFHDVSSLVKDKLIEVLAECCFIENLGYVTIDYLTFKIQNSYIKHLILSYLINIISGRNELPRSSKISYIINSMQNLGNHYFTLHGAKISLVNDVILITYHNKIKNKLSIKQELQDNLLWDNRFLFKVSTALKDNFSVDFCSEKEYTEIIDEIDLNLKKQFSKKALKEIILSLPAIKMPDKIVAISQINYYDKSTGYLEEALEVIFYPTFKSKLIHF